MAKKQFLDITGLRTVVNRIPKIEAGDNIDIITNETEPNKITISSKAPKVDGVTITYNKDGQLTIVSNMYPVYLNAECSGRFATITDSKYIGSDKDYLIDIFCEDENISIVSRKIEGNTLIVEFNKDVSNITVTATEEGHNIIDVITDLRAEIEDLKTKYAALMNKVSD